jgi:hypothetical protein
MTSLDSTTPTTSATYIGDAEIDDLIRRIRDLWARSRKVDGRLPRLTHDACDLEFRLFSTTEPATHAGFAARAREIRVHEWSAEEIAVIACRWGRDAERLGIEDGLPYWLTDSDDNSATGAATEQHLAAAR